MILRGVFGFMPHLKFISLYSYSTHFRFKQNITLFVITSVPENRIAYPLWIWDEKRDFINVLEGFQ